MSIVGVFVAVCQEKSLHLLGSIKIKVCGVTRADDLQLLGSLGVDAAGLNFYPKSPRCLTLESAQQLMDFCPQSLVRVGVFVNASADTIVRTAERCGLHAAQLHGEEPVELLTQLADRAPHLHLIRSLAWRGPSDTAQAADCWLAAAERRSSQLGWLIDTHAPQQRGGTGETWRWSDLSQRPSWLRNQHWLLAGGLTADNVAEAIRQARPDGIDAASGVESRPGVKDPARLQRFVEAARAAFDRLSAGGEPA
jgi:phosphoribosylanthranilate isomerase